MVEENKIGKEGLAPIRDLLNSIKNKPISSENYLKTYEEVRHMAKVVDVMLGGKVGQYNEKQEKLSKLIGEDDFTANSDRGIVRKEIYELIVQIVGVQREIIDWRTIYAELIYEMLKQSVGVFEVNKALDIKSEALKEVRLMINDNYNVQNEALTNKAKIIDESFVNALKVLDHNARVHNEDMKDSMDKTFNRSMELLCGFIGKPKEEVAKEIGYDFRNREPQSLRSTFDPLASKKVKPVVAPMGDFPKMELEKVEEVEEDVEEKDLNSKVESTDEFDLGDDFEGD